MSKTITTFLMSDNPRGARWIAVQGKQCRLYIISVEEVDLLKSHANEDDFKLFGSPCLYFLLNDEQPSEAYIGYAESFQHRVVDHLHKKKWWKKVFLFVNTSLQWNATQTHYMEHLSIDLAQKQQGYHKLDNKNTPNAPYLPIELKEPTKEAFEQVQFLVDFVGCPIFGCQAVKKSMEQMVFTCTGKATNAQGFFDKESQTFTVCANSILDGETVPSYKDPQKRKDWLAKYTIRTKGNTYLLTKDVEFATPSAAAVMVLGRPANGWDEWKNEDGKKLKEVYEH